MKTGKWVCRMFAAILPWSPRAERRARVEAARRGAEQSQRKAGEARVLRADIRAAVEQNHWVQIIADGLAAARQRGDREA